MFMREDICVNWEWIKMLVCSYLQCVYSTVATCEEDPFTASIVSKTNSYSQLDQQQLSSEP